MPAQETSEVGPHAVASRPALAEVEAAVSKYTPSPYTPGWEIWFGAVAAAVPFVIGSWEFGKRIVSTLSVQLEEIPSTHNVVTVNNVVLPTDAK